LRLAGPKERWLLDVKYKTHCPLGKEKKKKKKEKKRIKKKEKKQTPDEISNSDYKIEIQIKNISRASWILMVFCLRLLDLSLSLSFCSVIGNPKEAFNSLRHGHQPMT
jgi:hypothetical protein